MFSVHDVSLSNDTFLSLKFTFHGVEIVAKVVSAFVAMATLLAVALSLKTMKKASQDSNFNGIMVRPPLIWYDIFSVFPLTGFHNSGILPVTRKLTSAVVALTLRLLNQ